MLQETDSKEKMELAVIEFLINRNRDPLHIDSISLYDRLKLAAMISGLGLKEDNLFNPIEDRVNRSESLFLFNNESKLIEDLYERGLLYIDESTSLDAFNYRLGTDYHVESYDTRLVYFGINIIDSYNVENEILMPTYLNNEKGVFVNEVMNFLSWIELDIFYDYLHEYNLPNKISDREYNVIFELVQKYSIIEVQNTIESAGKYVMSEIMASRASYEGAQMFILNVAKKYFSRRVNRMHNNIRVNKRPSSIIERIFFEHYLAYEDDIYKFNVKNHFSDFE